MLAVDERSSLSDLCGKCDKKVFMTMVPGRLRIVPVMVLMSMFQNFSSSSLMLR
jgi:hypothetical protein